MKLHFKFALVRITILFRIFKYKTTTITTKIIIILLEKNIIFIKRFIGHILSLYILNKILITHSIES